ncbi:MAG: cell wall-binding repeat-containing protein [Solirubrobacterales bacterium]|nr:cell wall-binding repeat-containing protein [Solirubrobacterales bacterium]
MKRGLLIVLALVAALAAGWLVGRGDEDEPTAELTGPGPDVVVNKLPAPEETDELGYPGFATKNTTRVAGEDAIAAAAGVALAVYPATGGGASPDAVSLVDARDWPSGVAAASLMAEPIGAPVLVTQGAELPQLSADAIAQLEPGGSADTGGAEAFAIGVARAPDELRSDQLEGDNPAELAVAIQRLRARLSGEDPEHVVVTTSDDPEYAMPAASWAARSGDPVLFVGRDTVPGPTSRALEELAKENVDVYVLGPEAAISEQAFDEIDEIAGGAERIEGEGPVASSIEFARFSDGSFGWNINDPGHGFVVASEERPLDAAAAAPLSASGTWGPLLVSDEVEALPADLRAYLLDLKPGYEDDPTRALYNHVWVIGDENALSVDFQAQLDEIAELAPVSSGTGSPQEENQPSDDRAGGSSSPDGSGGTS